MQDKEVRGMLIMNRQNKLVGVVSLGDIARTTGETELAGRKLSGEIAEAACSTASLSGRRARNGG
jgi:CBS domain-containing protein